MVTSQRMLLVGCGKMGSALLASWKNLSGLEISILDGNVTDSYKFPEDLPEKKFDIIVLAIKPQILNEVLGRLTQHVTSSLYISIAAGKSLQYLEDILPDSQAIVRAMPNIPALVGESMTVAIANRPVNQSHKALTEKLFNLAGKFEWLEDEKLMDAVTAVSGSGPAYVFLLIEELAKAGIAEGLPVALAVKLARQTIIGSARLVESLPDVPAETLRRDVTSPGGTTEAALNILMSENGLSDLIHKAIKAAAVRSRELS